MRKSEVYSWRLSPQTKRALEQQARRERTTVSEILDRITQEWLRDRAGAEEGDGAVQARMRAAAARVFGSIHGGAPRRSERARSLVRARLLNGQRSGR